jgi:hypothetical protein
MGHSEFKSKKIKMSAFASKSSIKPVGLANIIVYDLCSQIIKFIQEKNYENTDFIDETLLAKILSHRWDYIKIDELIDFVIFNTKSEISNQDTREQIINLFPSEKKKVLKSLGEDTHNLVSMIDYLITDGKMEETKKKEIVDIIGSIWTQKFKIIPSN